MIFISLSAISSALIEEIEKIANKITVIKKIFLNFINITYIIMSNIFYTYLII